jgi:hypothetical protein
MKPAIIKLVIPFFLLTLVAVDYASARGGGGRGGGGRSGGSHMSGGHHHGGGFRHHGFRSGTRFGFFVGGALVPWYYYYGPPYYAPSPYSVGYVEQDGFWYYCPALQTYNPYVMQCPGEWQRVDPQPPAPPAPQTPPG